MVARRLAWLFTFGASHQIRQIRRCGPGCVIICPSCHGFLQVSRLANQPTRPSAVVFLARNLNRAHTTDVGIGMLSFRAALVCAGHQRERISRQGGQGQVGQGGLSCSGEL
ncbi:hypothetical protein BGZ61DRAFT_439410 [Ilyonectria robusta]|uniref:uncharacterized protein n=1 Tax=Ilyonectria robusta TaxID=1079257 RepID=UPI001E8E7DA0|nr:uncharacterized protein BGZ61DRAFT_439410 [Ilyonectria robusta]KAH8738002.1 hypothetical protein BGZ61DRAFT_439410 [Ilyonectria robusta]